MGVPKNYYAGGINLEKQGLSGKAPKNFYSVLDRMKIEEGGGSDNPFAGVELFSSYDFTKSLDDQLGNGGPVILVNPAGLRDFGILVGFGDAKIARGCMSIGAYTDITFCDAENFIIHSEGQWLTIQDSYLYSDEAGAMHMHDAKNGQEVDIGHTSAELVGATIRVEVTKYDEVRIWLNGSYWCDMPFTMSQTTSSFSTEIIIDGGTSGHLHNVAIKSAEVYLPKLKEV